MKYFVILLTIASFTFFIPSAFASCVSLPCDDANIKLGEPNYRFIDFSYQNKVGEPITFVLEKTAYDQCNSYVATITNEKYETVWEQNEASFCVVVTDQNLITSQIKLGYDPDNKIIMSESAKYLLKVQIDDGSIEKEFTSRQNVSSFSLDRTVYPVTWTFSPLKQFDSGVPFDEIYCKHSLMLVQKYDYSPACVTESTKQKLTERGWTNINTDKIRQMVSLPSPPDPMSITITGNDKLPIFTIKRGETKEIGILLEPKIPITIATVSVDSYFGSAGDCNNISTDSYCPGRGIIMNLSETEITAKKEITLTITIPENMTVGTYGYQIETKTTFDMPSVEKPRTVGNSVRFDLKVI
ncbi:MAG: hypothetical protein ACW9W3_06340 [Candidatus Nitrosopumilus sp. bin_68KS]